MTSSTARPPHTAEWFGNLPTRWKIAKFGRSARLITAKAQGEQFKVALENVESGSGRFADSAVGDLSGEGIEFKRGDLLFGKLRPYLAKAWLADRDGAAVGDFHVYRPYAYDGRFLLYLLLNQPYIDLVNGSTYGAKMPRASWDFVRDVAQPIPPLDEQRQIAEYLDRETGKIDELIAKQVDLVAKLAERKHAVVAEAVAAIGETKTIPLKYIYSRSRASNQPAMTVLSVYRDYGVIPKSSRADNFNKTPEDLTGYLVVQPGNLVVNKMKAWQGSLGVSEHAGIVSPDYEVARPVSNFLSARFTHHLLRSRQFVAEYGVRSVGIRPSQWRLYWDQLGEMRVPVPSLGVQDELVCHIEREVAQIDALSDKADDLVRILRERRAALITAAVIGKIDVRGL